MSQNPFESGSAAGHEQRRIFAAESVQFQGEREEQEDVCEIAHCDKEGAETVVVVLADGHGSEGKIAAEDAVFTIIDELKEAKEIDQQELMHAFAQADQRVRSHVETSGAATTALVIEKGQMRIAWVGNAQVFTYADDGKLHEVTPPHEYGKHPQETDRLTSLNAQVGNPRQNPAGSVKKEYIKKGNGYLEVSRSLGDADFDPYVAHEPEVRDVPLSANVKFVLVASDGLWNLFQIPKNKQVIESVLSQAQGAEEATQMIKEKLEKIRLDDNTTVVVVEVPQSNI